jgi:hypothetical protein
MDAIRDAAAWGMDFVLSFNPTIRWALMALILVATVWLVNRSMKP